MSDLPFIFAICPTYRRPRLIPNVLAMWNAQTYPEEKRHLLILDDGQSFKETKIGSWSIGVNCSLKSLSKRVDTLGNKFSVCVANREIWSDGRKPKIILFEDDDVYFPGYVAAHAKVLQEHHMSQSEFVYSNDGKGYGPKTFHRTNAKGCHHGAWGYSVEAYNEAGGYNPEMNAGFDFNLDSRMRALGHKPQEPFTERIEYLYRWQTAGQAVGARYPNGSGWGDDIYENTEKCHPPEKFEGPLEPYFDDETDHYYKLYHEGAL